MISCAINRAKSFIDDCITGVQSLVRQARQLPYLNFKIHLPYLNQGGGGRLCPPIGIASPKNL